MKKGWSIYIRLLKTRINQIANDNIINNKITEKYKDIEQLHTKLKIKK